MQFFSTPRTARPPVAPPAVVAAARPTTDELDAQLDGCGWYDSSFDLSKGLDVTEQDCDLGYQLCQLLC